MTLYIFEQNQYFELDYRQLLDGPNTNTIEAFKNNEFIVSEVYGDINKYLLRVED